MPERTSRFLKPLKQDKPKARTSRFLAPLAPEDEPRSEPARGRDFQRVFSRLGHEAGGRAIPRLMFGGRESLPQGAARSELRDLLRESGVEGHERDEVGDFAPIDDKALQSQLTRILDTPLKANQRFAKFVSPERRAGAKRAREFRDRQIAEQFSEMFPGVKTVQDVNRLHQRLDVVEARSMLNQERMALAQEGDVQAFNTNPDHALIDPAQPRKGFLFEINTPDEAKAYIERRKARREAGEKLSEPGALLTLGASAADAATFGLFTNDVDERTIAAGREALSRDHGLAGDLAGAASDFAGALIPIGALHTAIARGAKFAGMSEIAASRLAGSLSMGIYSAPQGGLEGFGKGAALGIVGPAMASRVRARLRSMGANARVQAIGGEAIGFTLAGQAIHGGGLEQAKVDAILGAITGGIGAKTVVGQDKALEARAIRRESVLGRRRARQRDAAQAKADAPAKSKTAESDARLLRERLGDDQAANQQVLDELGIGKQTQDEVKRQIEAKEPTTEPVVDITPDPVPPSDPVPPKPQEPGPPLGDDFATSVKNRQVNKERFERGAPELAKAVRQSQPETVDLALKEIAENPNRPAELVSELANKPRAVDPTEQAILSVHRVNLHKARAKADADGIKAAESGDADAVAAAKIRADEIGSQFDVLDEVTRRSGGTETARSLAFRRAMMKEDFSLLAMESRRRRENDFKPLTEKQAAETKALNEKLSKAIAERDAHAEKLADLQSKIEADKNIPAVVNPKTPNRKSKSYGESNSIFTKEARQKAIESIRKKLGGLKSGIDPTVLADIAKVGGFHLEAGVRNFASWSRAMIADLGEKVRPHLKAVWNDARKQLAGQSREASVKGLKDGLASGRPITEMQTEIGRLAESFVAEGITKRDPLVDAVHAELKKIDPKVTRRDTQDAISGYGRQRRLNPDPIKAELRELKGQLLQVSKLQDMAAGKPPKKTGAERQEPGQLQRELIRQVNEAKKRGGFDVTDPASQLKSALDGVKTRLRNQISDLEKQINTGQRILPSRRAPVPKDAEAKGLIKRRDELKAEFTKLFGERKRTLTDAQRVKAAEKATQRSIKEIERRIKERDLFPTKSKDAPTSPELEALRARRDSLKEDLKELQLIAKPPKSKEEIALQSLKTRLKREDARLKERLANQDFEVRKPKPIPRDAEATRLEANFQMTKEAWNKALLKDKLANRSKLQKTLSAIFVEGPNTARAILSSMDLSAVLRQGGMISLGRPIRAAKALPSMFRALKSPEGMAREDAKLRARDNFDVATSNGLFIAEQGVTTLAKMEEAFMSRWAERIPGVAASNRAFNAFLNRIRMDSFDAMAATLTRTGQPTPKEAKAIANYINVATGRGSLGQRRNAMAGLSTVLWAPRLVASRFQLLAGQPLHKGTARTRKLIAGEYARTLMGLGVVYGLAQLAGGEIETDSRSSDFGKIRMGDTRVDPMFGLSQATVFTSRVASGETKSLSSGKVTPLRGEDVPFGSGGVAETIFRFLRTKLSPVLGSGLNVISGENVIGEKVTLGSEALGSVQPLVIGDILEVMEEQGVPKGTALSLLAIFGAGIQTFDPASKKKSKPKNKRLRVLDRPSR